MKVVYLVDFVQINNGGCYFKFRDTLLKEVLKIAENHIEHIIGGCNEGCSGFKTDI